MRKELKYITLATMLAVGAAGCKNGNDGSNGSNGQDGKNGQNGENGRNGLDNSINGVDHARLHVIGATAIDGDGSAEDDTILVDFATDVTGAAADLDSSKLTFSYAKRKASKFSVQVNSSLPEYKGLPVANLDMPADDGVGITYTYFFLELSEATYYGSPGNMRPSITRLVKAINDSIGVPDAVSVAYIQYGVGDSVLDNTIEGYRNSSTTISMNINHDISLVNFDDEGNDVGIVVTIPAFTITDYAGNGNEEFKFRLMSNTAIAAQVEPEALAFNPATDILDYSTYNENCILEKSGFQLSFATPMDINSTELAIKRQLEAHELLNLPGRDPITVEVIPNFDGMHFIVKPSENINLWVLEGDNAPTVSSNYDKFITCALDFSIPQYHATTKYGIDNASGPLSFHVTDITHPELDYQNAYIDDYHNVTTFNSGYQFPYEYAINDQKDTDTVKVTLYYDNSSSSKARAKDGNNPYLEEGDIIYFAFTETVKQKYDKNADGKLSDHLKEKLLSQDKLEKYDGSNWVKINNADYNSLNITCDGTEQFINCYYTIPSGYRFKTEQEYIINPVTLDNDKVIDIEAGTNNVAIKQKEGRKLVAHSPNWLVAPSVLSYKDLMGLPEGSDGLFSKNSLAAQNVYDLPEDEADIEKATAFVGLAYDYLTDRAHINMDGYGLTSLLNFENQPELENATIGGNSSNKDSIVVFFNKYMNETVTKQHLAYIIGYGNLDNAKRYTANPNDPENPATPVAGFNINTSNIQASYDPSNRVHRFIVKLGANQYIKADGGGDVIFDMAPVAKGQPNEDKVAIDVVRLPINTSINKLVIPVKIFDPSVKPVLESVVGKHTSGSRHCGNMQAEEKDTITFTFNHLLRHDRKDKVSGDEQASDMFIKRQIFKQVQKLLIDGARNEVGDKNREAWSKAVENINYGHVNAADFMTITSNEMDGDASMDWFRSKVVYTVTIAADPVNVYDPEATLNWSSNRPRYHFDVSQPLEFSFDPDTVVTSFGQVAENKAAVTANMGPFDELRMNLSVINNVVENDGKFIAHDSFQVSFNCPMDDFYTLKAIQKGFDELAGDGIFRVSNIKDYAKDAYYNDITGSNKSGYQVEVLPGREFNVAGGKMLNVENVATWTIDDKAENSEIIAGPFKAGVSDAVIPDKIFRFVPGSNQGFQAQYKADTAANAGIWYLSGVSNGLGRVYNDIAVIFSK